MGWTGQYNVTKREALDRLLNGTEVIAQGWSPDDASVYYVVYKSKDGNKYLIQILVEKHGNETLTKEIGEEAGPANKASLPAKVAKAIDWEPRNEWARQFRAQAIGGLTKPQKLKLIRVAYYTKGMAEAVKVRDELGYTGRVTFPQTQAYYDKYGKK